LTFVSSCPYRLAGFVADENQYALLKQGTNNYFGLSFKKVLRKISSDLPRWLNADGQVIFGRMNVVERFSKDNRVQLKCYFKAFFDEESDVFGIKQRLGLSFQ